MKLIGLTGGIASGKSTVSLLFKEHGITVIDADAIAKDVVMPGRRANALIRKHFGDEVFLADGHIDRAKLGQIIFNDASKRRILNKCTHPFVRLEMMKQAFYCWIKGARLIVFDVPLLFESGLDKLVGTTVVVYCSEVLQLQRLMKRDKGLGEEQAKQRIAAQMPLSRKAERADKVIDNSADVSQLQPQVRRLVRELEPSTVQWLLEYAGPPIALAAFVTLLRTYLPLALEFIGRHLVITKLT